MRNNDEIISKLGIYSKLCDLPLYDCLVAHETLGREISILFKSNPTLPGVIVTRDGKAVGLVSRDMFFEVLSNKFGREIFSKRPIDKIVKTYRCDYLELDANCPIRRAAQTAFSRDEKNVQNPIIVKYADGTIKLLSAFDLLKAQSHIIILSDRILSEHKQKMREQKITEEQIRKQNKLLEERVAARTRELEEIQKELIEASRRAGMSEVATDVLHNVGNVLTSVNISTNLISEQLGGMEINNIQEIVKILRENQPQLGSFFESDETGRHILPYLDEVSKDLSSQHENLIEKLDSLKMYVDHLKEITRTQQNYAKLSTFVMEVDPREIVSDAIKINSAALARHKVELVQEIEDTGILILDKQKILQIMVNLINNAKYATDANGRDQKWIRIRLFTDQQKICFEVQDNGIGIAPENMTKIFQHGFTTKKEGHGFGLHGGSLAAKEMGGELLVFSDGAGKGATFRLELPLEILEKING